ncbi:MAG: alpha/beta hydrolase, partial [Sphingomonadaceae bacterium]|nr:alpha/beta hydrolase [Sphingomonadaceae bacterium]
AMVSLVDDLFEQTGRKVSIIGWSLGGVFARELAKLAPEKVRLVISLGSPISDDRNHSNARRLFEYLNGEEPEPMKEGNFAKLGEAPPVPTTSILTKTDGVVHWRGSVQFPDDANHGQTENIEVLASHCGMGVNPAVMFAIADRLAQKEGNWKPFHARGLASLFFPRTRLLN